MGHSHPTSASSLRLPLQCHRSSYPGCSSSLRPRNFLSAALREQMLMLLVLIVIRIFGRVGIQSRMQVHPGLFDDTEILRPREPLETLVNNARSCSLATISVPVELSCFSDQRNVLETLPPVRRVGLTLTCEAIFGQLDDAAQHIRLVGDGHVSLLAKELNEVKDGLHRLPFLTGKRCLERDLSTISICREALVYEPAEKKTGVSLIYVGCGFSDGAVLGERMGLCHEQVKLVQFCCQLWKLRRKVTGESIVRARRRDLAASCPLCLSCVDDRLLEFPDKRARVD